MSALAGGLRGLSLVAACTLVVGAVFLLTSNQGCMRVIGRPPASAPQTSNPAPSPAQEQGAAHESARPPANHPSPSRSTAESDRSGRDPLTDTRTSSSSHEGEVSRGSTSSPKIALTFDAGAAGEPTDKILKALAKHSLHSTFFLTGKWIERYPELCRRIVDEGHEIGNHTYSHPRLTAISDGEIINQMEKTEQLALRVTGKSTKPLFRPPFGARNKHVLDVVGGLGYRSIYWHVDCWDSVKAGITSDQITKRVLKLVGNGSIVLMHCGSQATANALDGLLTQLEERGYKPVTVSELLAP